VVEATILFQSVFPGAIIVLSANKRQRRNDLEICTPCLTPGRLIGCGGPLPIEFLVSEFKELPH
jgi:hypothetical protein